MRTPGVILVSLVLVAGMTCTQGSPASAETPRPPTARADGVPLSKDAEQDLDRALRRDLNMSVGEFKQAGSAAEKATVINAKLKDTPGFESIALDKGTVVVKGQGAAVEKAARTLGVKVAPSTKDAKSPTLDALKNAYLQEVGQNGLVAIAQTAKGFSITVLDPQAKKAGKKSAQAFSRQYKNIEIKKADTPATPTVDLYGGFGYGVPSGAGRVICSFAFPTFDLAGNPGMLTAGHCAEGRIGAPVTPNDPYTEPAIGGQGSSPIASPLGKFEWSQFGAPSGASGSYGTDLAEVKSINTYVYYLAPAVLKWQKASPQPYASPVRVTGWVDPVLGAPICKSGRSTGWRCSTISYIGYVNVQKSTSDYRLVYSAGSTDLWSVPGDSGGAALVGNKAVGVTSAIATEAGKTVTYVSLIRDLSAARDSTQIKVWLNTPAIVSKPYVTSRWRTGELISGTIPPEHNDTLPWGTVLQVLVNDEVTQTIPVTPEGDFSFTYTGPSTYREVKVRAAKFWCRSREVVFSGA